jgi:hypothetical protein
MKALITDAKGNVVDEMNFDAWGNRRSKWDLLQKESGVTHLINGKIQRFVSANYGTRNKTFSLCRIANYFS